MTNQNAKKKNVCFTISISNFYSLFFADLFTVCYSSGLNNRFKKSSPDLKATTSHTTPTPVTIMEVSWNLNAASNYLDLTLKHSKTASHVPIKSKKSGPHLAGHPWTDKRLLISRLHRRKKLQGNAIRERSLHTVQKLQKHHMYY